MKNNSRGSLRPLNGSKRAPRCCPKPPRLVVDSEGRGRWKFIRASRSVKARSREQSRRETEGACDAQEEYVVPS
jgi:hypothetical protein